MKTRYDADQGRIYTYDPSIADKFNDLPLARHHTSEGKITWFPDIAPVLVELPRIRQYIDNSCASANEAADVDPDSMMMHLGLLHVDFSPRVERWTTAPVDYDNGSTLTLETVEVEDILCAPPRTRTWRRVSIQAQDLTWHEYRYGSGLKPCQEKDPRVEMSEIKASIERDREERAKRDTAEKENAEWLKSAPISELEEAQDDIAQRRPYLDYSLLQKTIRERKAAEELRTASAQYSAWVERIPENVIVDQFAMRGGDRWGIGAAAEKCGEVIYYGLKPGYFQLRPGSVAVTARAPQHTWDLEFFIHLMDKGSIRPAPDTVPPEPVVERFHAYDRLNTIMRVEAVDGKTVWVGRKLFGYELLVLDENGHLVRSKRIKDTATDAYLKREHSR